MSSSQSNRYIQPDQKPKDSTYASSKSYRHDNSVPVVDIQYPSDDEARTVDSDEEEEVARLEEEEKQYDFVTDDEDERYISEDSDYEPDEIEDYAEYDDQLERELEAYEEHFPHPRSIVTRSLKQLPDGLSQLTFVYRTDQWSS